MAAAIKRAWPDAEEIGIEVLPFDRFNIFYRRGDNGYEMNSCNLLFNHELGFARAFWGETPAICTACRRSHYENRSDCDAGCGTDYYFWQYHLQQMVLEEEPIKYLEPFLTQDK